MTIEYDFHVDAPPEKTGDSRVSLCAHMLGSVLSDRPSAGSIRTKIPNKPSSTGAPEDSERIAAHPRSTDHNTKTINVR